LAITESNDEKIETLESMEEDEKWVGIRIED